MRDEEGGSDPDSSSWGRSSAWLEHSTVTREVAGSNPVAPVLDSLQLMATASQVAGGHSDFLIAVAGEAGGAGVC